MLKCPSGRTEDWRERERMRETEEKTVVRCCRVGGERELRGEGEMKTAEAKRTKRRQRRRKRKCGERVMER